MVLDGDRSGPIEKAPPAAWWRRPGFQLGAILVLGGVLRLARLGHESMWFDETLTVTTARLPLRDVLASVEILENMPPLYFYLMNFWAHVAGTSDLAMRLPSAAAGVASVGMIYAVACRLAPPRWGQKFALVAALLLAISRYHIAYCQQARPYSTVVLLVLISSWSFLVLLEAPLGERRRWPTYIYLGSSVAMLWMQPFSALSLMAQNIFYFGWVSWDPSKRLPVRRWLLMQGLIALAFGPWVNRQLMAARIGSPWMRMPTFTTTLLSYAGGSTAYLVAISLLALIAAAMQLRRTTRATGFFFAVLLATLPIVLPICASTPKHPLFVPRYGIAGLVGIELLTAWGIVMVPKGFGALAMATVAALAAPSLASDLYRGTTFEHRADVRAAAKWVDQHASPAAEYFCVDGLQSRVFEMYRARADLQPNPAPTAKQYWLVYQPTSTSQSLRQPAGYALVDDRSFSGVAVARFCRQRPPR